jgi:hypothetical protein
MKLVIGGSESRENRNKLVDLTGFAGTPWSDRNV